LLRLLRERPQDPDRPRRLPERPRGAAGLARRARHRLLRLLVGDRRAGARLRSGAARGRLPRHRPRGLARGGHAADALGRGPHHPDGRARMTDIATRVYDHTWRIDPIVRSLHDTDFYKLLMLQTVYRRHADVRVKFSLI